LGADQFARPSTRMNAGTSRIRTSVASTSTATVSPNPNKRMKDTFAAISAAKEIVMMSAAAVITRPVWATPRATLSSLAPQPRTVSWEKRVSASVVGIGSQHRGLYWTAQQRQRGGAQRKAATMNRISRLATTVVVSGALGLAGLGLGAGTAIADPLSGTYSLFSDHSQRKLNGVLTPYHNSSSIWHMTPCGVGCARIVSATGWTANAVLNNGRWEFTRDGV